METTLRYNYRLRPGAQAVEALTADWHRCRWIWNQMVANRYSKTWEFINGKDLTAARKKIPWLREGVQVVQQQTMRAFSGKGRCNFKSKHEKPSLQYTRNGFSLRDGRLHLTGRLVDPCRLVL